MFLFDAMKLRRKGLRLIAHYVTNLKTMHGLHIYHTPLRVEFNKVFG